MFKNLQETIKIKNEYNIVANSVTSPVIFISIISGEL